jgi:hypothetical protein
MVGIVNNTAYSAENRGPDRDLCQNYEDTDESKRFFNIFHLVFPPLVFIAA